jgi:hypothetical protein
MYKVRNSIVQQFPDFEEKIDFLFQTDENFRDLCSDYLLCISMILVRKNNIEYNKSEIGEFQHLKKDMKEEILKEIQKAIII